MIEDILKVIDSKVDYWLVKNHHYGFGGEEKPNARVLAWCEKVWEKLIPDKRYKLGYVIFRRDRGDGFKQHRDFGSGKEAIIIVLKGRIFFQTCDCITVLRAGNFLRIRGNELHGLDKHGHGKYLVLFSKRLKD